MKPSSRWDVLKDAMGGGEEGEKMELHELTKHDVKMHTRYRKVCSIKRFSIFVMLVETR